MGEVSPEYVTRSGVMHSHPYPIQRSPGALQRAFAFGAIRQLVPPLALFERPLMISGRTLLDAAANHALTGRCGRPSIEGWQLCCDGRVLFDVCCNSSYFLLRLLDTDPVCIVIELTNQMYPVKDIDSFVEAMVECFSDPAPWGYKLEGNLEL